MDALEKSMNTIARAHTAPARSLIETTVGQGNRAGGVSDYQEVFEHRGITSEPVLAHSYERVMPGQKLRCKHTRFLAGVQRRQRESKRRVGEIPERGAQHQGLSTHGPRQADRIGNGEIVENSYRAPFSPSSTSGASLRNRTV